LFAQAESVDPAQSMRVDDDGNDRGGWDLDDRHGTDRVLVHG
jgi:hypothetical protein